MYSLLHTVVLQINSYMCSCTSLFTNICIYTVACTDMPVPNSVLNNLSIYIVQPLMICVVLSTPIAETISIYMVYVAEAVSPASKSCRARRQAKNITIGANLNSFPPTSWWNIICILVWPSYNFNNTIYIYTISSLLFVYTDIPRVSHTFTWINWQHT